MLYKFIIFITLSLGLWSKTIKPEPNITLSVEQIDISIEFSNTDYINIKTENISDFDLNYSLIFKVLRGNLLSIKIQKKSISFTQKQNLKIIIPKNIKNITSFLDGSDLDISSQVSIDNLSIYSNGGNINIKSLNSKYLEINGVYGDINLSDIVSDGLFLLSKSGKIDIDNLICDISIESQSSDIFINKIKGDLKINNQFGDVNIKGLNAKENVNIKTESGNIKFTIDDFNKYRFSLFSNFGKIKLDEKIYYKEIQTKNSVSSFFIEAKSVSGNLFFDKEVIDD